MHAVPHMLELPLRDSRKFWSKLSGRSTGPMTDWQKVLEQPVLLLLLSRQEVLALKPSFVKELIALGAKVKNVWAPYEVVHGIYRSIAIAVANGNADILCSRVHGTDRHVRYFFRDFLLDGSLNIGSLHVCCGNSFSCTRLCKQQHDRRRDTGRRERRRRWRAWGGR